MNYLFFDIEGANSYGGVSKICSFGYVLTNEEFEVLEQKDILVNPRSKFNLGPNIKLAYEKDEFKAAGDFTKHYEEIRAVLLQPDVQIFGFAVDNDAKYVRDECKRYHLEGMNFDYFDVQRMVRDKFALDNQPGLPKACELLSIDFDQDIHKSDEDALMTMEVLKAVCQKFEKNVEELVEESPTCHGRLEDGEFRWLNVPAKSQESIDRSMNRMTGENGNLKKFLEFCESVTPSKKAPSTFAGKEVCISMNYERRNFAQMMTLVQMIVDRGGKYTTKASQCNMFVTSEYFRSGGKPCVRIENVLDLIGRGKEIELIDFSELLDLLGISEKQLNKISLAEINKENKDN